MTGTEKQIAWAEDIKAAPIRLCEDNAARFENTIPKEAALYRMIGERYKTVIAQLGKKPEAESAAWWINNRNNLPTVERIVYLVHTMQGHGKSQENALKAVFGF